MENLTEAWIILFQSISGYAPLSPYDVKAQPAQYDFRGHYRLTNTLQRRMDTEE